MTNGQMPDFSGWSTTRLAGHLAHLDRLLLASIADPSDPLRAQLRAERKAASEALKGKS